jgi:hypothetical protein
MQEIGKWRVLRILEKYDEDIDQFRRLFGKANGERLFFDTKRPYETTYQPGNLLLVGGVATLWQMAIGNGSTSSGNALCYINNANATIGVGDSNTAEVYTQQDLQAASNKYYQGMDASYPLTTDVVLPGQTTVKTITAASNASPISVTSNVIVFKSTIGPSNANFVWNEWVIKNGTGGSSRAFNRKVSSLGTKSSGTWALTAGIAIA